MSEQPPAISFRTEKGFYEYACDIAKIAVIDLKLPREEERKVLDIIDEACKKRLEKLRLS